MNKWATSWSGHDLDDFHRLGFPYVIGREVGGWTEFQQRADEVADWVNGFGLIEEEDFLSDVTDYAKMDLCRDGILVELWAFKDRKIAMLFKLTFV